LCLALPRLSLVALLLALGLLFSAAMLVFSLLALPLAAVLFPLAAARSVNTPPGTEPASSEEKDQLSGFVTPFDSSSGGLSVGLVVS
ncbi:hypothetical protein ACC673_37580, partial [Rhizobium ruizarguesonis]